MRITKDPVLDAWELAESDEAKRPATDRDRVPANPNRLLIVDDEDSVRRITQSVLEANLPETFDYDFASNGEEAVRLFARTHHKVILLDLAMPVMDGEQAALKIMDLCEESKWEPPSIVFRTGYAPPGNVRNLVAVDPAHCLLRKPVRNQTLVTAVKKRLGI